jgi:hypothetical protein
MVIRSQDSATSRNATVQLTNDSDREHHIATKTTADGHFLLKNVPVQCAGFLLAEWGSIAFDAKTSILRMMVYCPVGEIFEKCSMRVCEVEERWFEARPNP